MQSNKNNDGDNITYKLKHYLDNLGIPSDDEPTQKYHVDAILGFIYKGANVNTRSKFGYSSLHFLVHAGDLPAIAKLLKNKKPNIESRDILGNTPLFLAIVNGQVEIVKYFVDRFTNIKQELRTRDKECVTELAVLSENQGMIAYIQELLMPSSRTRGNSEVVFSSNRYNMNHYDSGCETETDYETQAETKTKTNSYHLT